MQRGKFVLLSALVFALTLVLAPMALAAGPWYVSPSGNDTNDCLSLATACLTIQAAIDKASPGDTINVGAGTYSEGIAINKDNLTITGAGASSTTIIGPKPSVVPGTDTVTFTSTGSTLQGFTITRAGNTVAEWTDTRTQGVTFTGTGNTLQNCVVTGNRNAILLASSGHFILNNTIDNNRTGIHINEGGNNTIQGNQITNNWTIGILYRQYVSGTGDVITDNTITGNWYSQVEDRGNPAGLVRNLQGNWFGPWPFTVVQQNTSGEPGYASQIPVAFGGTATPPATTPTFVVNVQDPNPNGDPGGRGNSNAVRLAYSPWLTTGINSVPLGTPGFQGDFSKLSVDAASAQFGGTSIQRGIDMVSAGGTVTVVAGTYVEDPVIDKAVSLLGPNATINPNSGTRVAEALIHPATSAPDPAICEVMVYIEVGNVTIKGFAFDGDNPALTSGVIIDGADVDACEILASYEGVGNIVVENNILKHSTYTGMDFYNYYNSGGATAGNYIRYNRLEDIGETTYNWGIGILIYNNFYADVSDNVLTGVRTGIQTGNYFSANPGTTGSISNNQIGVWRLGIFHNLAYGGASPFTITGNTMSAETYPGATKWNGLLLSSIGSAVNATITDNDIVIPGAVSFSPPGYTAGYNVWNVTTTAPIAISGGTVVGGDYGVFVNNYEGYTSNADNTAVKIDGVTVLDSDIAGIYVKDSPSNTNSSTVHANIQNCVINTDATGIFVEGADATAIANYNKIAGNPTSGATNTTGVLMDAENNYWGAVSGPGPVGAGTGDKVTTNVDYEPWCNEDFSICGYTTATMTPTTGDALFCVGETTTVNIDVATVANLYGYQFEVTYDATKASAAGAFVDTFFDTTTNAVIAGGWSATCSAGTCRFGVSKQSPGVAVTGGGTLAAITFTGVAPGTFPVTIGSGAELTDIDGELLARTLAAPLPLTVCGSTTVSGKVTLQGRSGNIVNAGTVTLTDLGGNFPTPLTVPFSVPDGSYSFANVPVMPTGSSYQMDASHGLYLTNRKTPFALSYGVPQTNQNTRLWGGDANNDLNVTISDLSCIGGSFGATPPGTCVGSADINADGRVNVQDLAIAGGNYYKCGWQPWNWISEPANMCP